MTDTQQTNDNAANDRAGRTAEAIETNPIAMLVGGLALGALIAALLPRGQREKDMLAPLGKRVNATAVAAFAAAKDVGRQELENRGLTPSAAKGQAQALFGEFVKAASTAGKAAADAGREHVRGS